MSLFAIPDLHLGFKHNKTMDKFGDIWINHSNKIKNNWENLIKEDDFIIISGDVSWAMDLEEAKPDFDFIDSLPGTKIMYSGNHDYWWAHIKK